MNTFKLEGNYTDMRGLLVDDGTVIALLKACSVSERQIINLVGRDLAGVNGFMLSFLSMMQPQVEFFENRRLGRTANEDLPKMPLQLSGFH